MMIYKETLSGNQLKAAVSFGCFLSLSVGLSPVPVCKTSYCKPDGSVTMPFFSALAAKKACPSSQFFKAKAAFFLANISATDMVQPFISKTPLYPCLWYRPRDNNSLELGLVHIRAVASVVCSLQAACCGNKPFAS